MRTTTEQLISRSRKGQMLVPMIEEFLRRPVNVENSDDVKFIHDLMLQKIEREELRREKRRFSPSSLASCLRQVYMMRNYTGPRERETRIEPNFYFMTGDWLHVKWQFVLYKMDKAGIEGFKLVDCEVPVASKHGDHGGTIDAVCTIWDEWTAIDFKGLNVRDFGAAVRGDVDLKYRIQLADYLILWNSTLGRVQPKLASGLIIVENKGGPDPNHPIALTEIRISADEYRPEVRYRLEELRKYERSQTIPYAECTSIHSLQFKSCPFRKYCRQEVKAIQNRNAKSRNTTELRVARPDRKRNSNTRGNSRK